MSEWLSPDVIASAPGRVNLIGEHIDYSQGFVLPFAISFRTTAQIRRRDDQVIRIRSKQQIDDVISSSISELAPGSQGGWERYVLGVIWALGINNGVDIEIDGEVPLGAGLSSSAALECAVATGLNELFSLGFDKKQLALLAQKAENVYVGVPCGIMDQSVSLLAEAGSALLLDCRDLSTTLVPFDLSASGLELLIIDTQVHHALVDGEYAKRRQACESACAKLHISSLRNIDISALVTSKQLLSNEEYKRAHHAVSEMARTLEAVAALKRKDFVALGALITQSHVSLRDDYKVSCPELNSAVDTALAHGALGARMVGGGFGGSAIALAEQSQIQAIKSAIADAFKSAQFAEPRFFTSLPSEGAKVIKRLDR
jgi:galactokinase